MPTDQQIRIGSTVHEGEAFGLQRPRQRLINAIFLEVSQLHGVVTRDAATQCIKTNRLDLAEVFIGVVIHGGLWRRAGARGEDYGGC